MHKCRCSHLMVISMSSTSPSNSAATPMPNSSLSASLAATNVPDSVAASTSTVDHASFVSISTSGEASTSPQPMSGDTITSMMAAAADTLVSIAPIDPSPSTTAFASTYAYLMDSKDWGVHWVLCVNCLILFEGAHGFLEVILHFVTI